MAHFYGTIQGNRGEGSRLGSMDSGLESHTRGWGLGCRVVMEYNKHLKRDEVSIFLTSGSNGGKSSIKLGTFKEEDLDKNIKVTIKRMNKKTKEKKEAENDPFRAVKMVCAFGSILCDTPEEKNKWNKRMIGTIEGINIPEDFDSLPEEEKARRLKGVLEVL